MKHNLKIGINPITWSNDDLLSLGKETTLETCLLESTQAGFSGVELGHKFPRKVKLLHPYLKKYNLELISGWYSMSLLHRSVNQEIKAVQDHLILLKGLACKVMVCCEVSGAIHSNQNMALTKKPYLAKKQQADFYKKISEFADYLQENQVQMAYHHHMGTLVQTEQDINCLMENTSKSVGLLLDTGHLVYAGGNWANIIDSWGDRINHIHCKDVRKSVLEDAKNRDLSFLAAVLNGVFTVPGDGFIDYGSIFQTLKKKKYQGWLVIEAEQDPVVAHPLTYATMGQRHLIKCLKQMN